MFFSKIELRRDTEAVMRLAQWLDQDGYRLHQSLWNLFKTDGQQVRDFLYRRIESQNWPCFYIVSARRPEDTVRSWAVQVKDYSPNLDIGHRLAFSLRGNPVITRPKGTKRARHDVVMDAKKHQDEASRLTLTELIQEAGMY